LKHRLDVFPLRRSTHLLLPLRSLPPNPTAFEFYETEPSRGVCQEKIGVGYQCEAWFALQHCHFGKDAPRIL
jgi:hypothetical protein